MRLILLLCIMLAACTKLEQTEQVKSNGKNELGLSFEQGSYWWIRIDLETGCQYIVGHNKMTPRHGPDGKPMGCKAL